MAEHSTLESGLTIGEGASEPRGRVGREALDKSIANVVLVILTIVLAAVAVDLFMVGIGIHHLCIFTIDSSKEDVERAAVLVDDRSGLGKDTWLENVGGAEDEEGMDQGLKEDPGNASVGVTFLHCLPPCFHWWYNLGGAFRWAHGIRVCAQASVEKSAVSVRPHRGCCPGSVHQGH